jgi:hypothetical protein
MMLGDADGVEIPVDLDIVEGALRTQPKWGYRRT